MNLGSVDLIYLDPPFNSNRAYNAIYKDSTGLELPDQVNAFCDLWELNKDRERVLQNIPVLVRDAGIDDSVAQFWKLWMQALRNTQPKLLAYLLYMVERLLVMKGILKPTGSIYLHCDPTASHYIKIMMDGIFGHDNFRNEIIWSYESGGRPKNDFARKHDVIFRYTKSNNWVFNSKDILLPREQTRHNHMKKSVDENGRVYYSIKSAGKIYKYYADEGVIPSDVWTEISHLNNKDPERLGYPTQKPVALLKRIIAASTNKDEVVFDPFCGCATTIAAAHELGRKWIGCDIAYHAIKRVVQERLEENYGLVEGVGYTVNGIPRTVEAAHDLWTRDKYHFQRWAVEYIDGFVTSKRTGDGGIDGRLYFHHPDHKELQSMVLEVKGGKHVGIDIVRELRGVLDRDDAMMAGLIIMDELTEQKRKNFAREMASVGDLDVMGVQYPKMQILSVQDILDGKRFLTPSVAKMGTRQQALPLFDTGERR